MTLESIQARLLDEIHQRGREDKFIDLNEEREILQIAIHQGIEIERARQVLATVCDREGYTQETVLREKIREKCRSVLAERGAMERADFDRIVDQARQLSQGRAKDRELRHMVVTEMEDHSLNRIRTGWLKNWYTSVKREVGLG